MFFKPLFKIKYLNSIFKYLFTFSLAVTTTNLFAQSDSVFSFTKSIKGNFTYFNVDNLDNIYLITSGNQLKKLNVNGDSIAVYNDVKKYGNPSFIDVTNPLKTLVYYKNYSTVVILDRLLAVRNTINLRKYNMFYVNNITLSYDNNIWLFDEEDYKLKKIDENGKVLLSTVDWRNLFDSLPAPSAIIDKNDFVYLYDPLKGFYIFDYYGSYKNRLPLLNWTNVAVNNNTLYGTMDSVLYSYQLNSLQIKEYKLPSFFGNYTSIKAMNGKVYILNEAGVDIYQIISK